MPPDPLRVRHEARLARAARTGQDRVADGITAFAGSMTFVYVHIVWFVVWLVVNLGLLAIVSTFDEFPFGLLTLIVSLEAIFLSTFVMISQNRSSQRADIRSQLDYETDVRSTVFLEHVADKLGIPLDHLEADIKKRLDGGA